MQGDSELNNILASLPEDTNIHHEKLVQIESGARIRDLVLVCQSLMEGVANNIEANLKRHRKMITYRKMTST